MIINFTNYKKLSLAFAITCTVATHVININAVGFLDKKSQEQGIQGKLEIGKTETPEGATEFYTKQAVDIKGAAKKDASQNIADKAKSAAKNLKEAAKKTGEDVVQTDSSFKKFFKKSKDLAAIPFQKGKQAFTNSFGKVVQNHPFITGAITGAVLTQLVNYYLFQKRANKNLLHNVTPEELNNGIIAKALLEFNDAEIKYQTQLAKIQTQGGSTLEDSATLAALENEVLMREAALVALIRSQKTTLEIIKAALLPNFK